MEEVFFKEHQGIGGSLVGEIVLNSEAHLNALSLLMVDRIRDKLTLWRNSEIRAIILDSVGEKAFCAGGDVVTVRKNIREKGVPQAETFFTREFVLDYEIHNYPKPIICWGAGIVMGGGMGLMNGCSHRVVTETSRLAMPEVAIGYYPDVGGSWFLNKIPKPFGLFLGLSGSPINGAEAIKINLADYFIASSKRKELLRALCEVDLSESPGLSVDQVLAKLSTESLGLKEAQPHRLQVHQKAILNAFDNNSLYEIYQALLNLEANDNWTNRMQESLRYGSPLAAHLVFRQLRRAENMSLREVFESEMILTGQCLRHQEFSEGVRARLVDKDNNPEWMFESIKEVDPEVVSNFFCPPWKTNPFNKLMKES